MKKEEIQSNKTTFFSWTKRPLLHIGFLVLLFLEIFVFNFPFWQSIPSNTTQLSFQDISISDNLKITDDGIFVTATGNTFIEINTVDKHNISYLKLNFKNTGSTQETIDQFDYSIAKAYNNSSEFHQGTQRKIYTKYPQSQFINIGGDVSSIRINIYLSENSLIPLDSIEINPHIPFRIDFNRIALILSLLIFIITFEPKSRLYSVIFDITKFKQRIAIYTTGAILTAIVCYTWVVSHGYFTWQGQHPSLGNHTANFDQYATLADSLLHGRVDLNLPINDKLASLSNPYDFELRSRIATPDSPIYLDHAFYNGKYYCYFGVIPALLLFVPYQLITGHGLPSAYAVLLPAAIGAFLTPIMLAGIASRFFKKVSIGSIMLSAFIFTFGSNVLYLAFTPSFYCVPQSFSYMFTIAAITCWLFSIQKFNHVEAYLSTPLIALGSLFMACNLGCRPQFIIAAILAIPIFWTTVFKDRLLFSAKSIASTFLAILPFAIVFIPLFYYNYLRFDSIFDFGSNYNLAVFDMTHATKPLISIFQLLFYYLFQPAILVACFPFISTTSTPMLTWSPMEPSIGGLFAWAPSLFVVFALPRLLRQSSRFFSLNKDWKKRSITLLTLFTISTGIVIVICNALVAGYAWRYVADFGWAFCIASAIAVYSYDQNSSFHKTEFPSSNQSQTVFRTFLFFSCLFSIIIQFLSMFIPGRYGDISLNNPDYYSSVASWFLFMS